MRIHIGSGFDVHAFDENKPLGQKICGVMIKDSLALKGHSDADVALHAIVDSLLGAISAGDIGLHFPPSDMQWKNADSQIFVDFAVQKLAEVKAYINNIDITIMCETPKINPYRVLMQEQVAKLLHVEKFQVNIKGTTTEKLGFLGRKEGIAVQSTVLVSWDI